MRRRIVWRRSLWNVQRWEPLLSWREIARREACHVRTAQDRYWHGIDEITRALRQAQRDVSSGIDRGRTALQIQRIMGGPLKPS